MDNILDNITIELTQKCNLRCMHCYLRIDQHIEGCHIQKTDISDSSIIMIMKEAKDLGCKNVVFSGGEPLCRSNFLDLCSYASSLGLNLSIATNGTIISKHIAQSLKKIRLQRISVTVYGFDRDSFAITTGQDMFDRLLESINNLKNEKIPFQIRFVAVPLLIENISKVHAFTKKLGVPLEDPYPWNITLNPYNHLSANQRICQVRLYPHQAALQRLKNHTSAIKLIKKLYNNKSKKTDNKIFSCCQKVNRLYIDANEQIWICAGVRASEIGYRYNGCLSEARQHFLKICNNYRYNNLFLERCGRCLFGCICGSCPASSWSEEGKLDGYSSYYCELTNSIAQLLGLLSKGKKCWEVENLASSSEEAVIVKLKNITF